MHDLSHESVDPVCGMRVAHDTEIRFVYRGVVYRFCDQACADTFRDDPARWVGDGDQPGFTHSHQQ